MSEKERTRLTALLRRRIGVLQEGPFKSRMEVRLKFLEEIPSNAWIGLAIVLLAMLGIFVYAKWAWRPLRSLALL